MITDLLQIGNKIDICALDKSEIKRTENGKVPILASHLEDMEESGELTIQMPVYKGKIILLSLGARYEMMFYTRKGLYRGVCQVTDRYKEDNLFMVKVMLKSGLNKFQRREYFRQCDGVCNRKSGGAFDHYAGAELVDRFLFTDQDPVPESGF